MPPEISSQLRIYHVARRGEEERRVGATRLRQTTVTREQRPCEWGSEWAGIDTEKAAVASESNQFIALPWCSLTLSSLPFQGSPPYPSPSLSSPLQSLLCLQNYLHWKSANAQGEWQTGKVCLPRDVPCAAIVEGFQICTILLSTFRKCQFYCDAISALSPIIPRSISFPTLPLSASHCDSSPRDGICMRSVSIMGHPQQRSSTWLIIICSYARLVLANFLWKWGDVYDTCSIWHFLGWCINYFVDYLFPIRLSRWQQGNRLMLSTGSLSPLVVAATYWSRWISERAGMEVAVYRALLWREMLLSGRESSREQISAFSPNRRLSHYADAHIHFIFLDNTATTCATSKHMTEIVGFSLYTHDYRALYAFEWQTQARIASMLNPIKAGGLSPKCQKLSFDWLVQLSLQRCYWAEPFLPAATLGAVRSTYCKMVRTSVRSI